MATTNQSWDKTLRIGWWILLAVFVALTVTLRVRLLDLPLERDEGEYAYAGQLLLQGIPPYQLAYNMKFPGTYAAYALCMSLFGQTIAGVHIGLLVVNVATIALVFLLGRRLLNTTAGAASAASYAVLSLSPSVLGFAGHASHFVIQPALGGALLLLRATLSKLTILASGILFGLALLMKQPGLFFIPFGLGFLLYKDKNGGMAWRAISARQVMFLGATLAPLAMTSLLLWRAGVFDKFWFWTVLYAREYGGLLSLGEAMPLLLRTGRALFAAGWPLWSLAALGLIAVVGDKKIKQSTRLFLLGLLVFSALAVCPGLYFRQHYFILLLPAICLFAGTTAAFAVRHLPPAVRVLPLLLFAAACVWPLLTDRQLFLASDLNAASRMIYGTNPFPESIRVAEYLKAHSEPTDKIAVLGSEPQIYFYAQRLSATGYIYTYGLMEPHAYAERMQREMIAEIEAARPRYLVVIRVDTSWLARSDQGNLIFDWFGSYGPENYNIVGLANIRADKTDYHFPLDSSAIELSPTYLLVYERKP